MGSSLFEMALDIFMLTTASDASLGGVSQLRVVRMLRITRFVRTLRLPRIVRFIGALRTMILSILMTLKTLVWAFVLLALMMYLFALIFTQSAVDAKLTGGSSQAAFEKHYGHLWISCLTLFKTITGGVSWQEVVDPLMSPVSWPLVLLFLSYVFFSQFAIVNVITGIFCNGAIETASRDPDLIAQSLVASKKQYIDKIRELFDSVDTDGSGNITVSELEDMMHNETM